MACMPPGSRSLLQFCFRGLLGGSCCICPGQDAWQHVASVGEAAITSWAGPCGWSTTLFCSQASALMQRGIAQGGRLVCSTTAAAVADLFSQHCKPCTAAAQLTPMCMNAEMGPPSTAPSEFTVCHTCSHSCLYNSGTRQQYTPPYTYDT